MIEYMNAEDRRGIRKRVKYLREKVEGKDFSADPRNYIELLAIKKLVRIAHHNGQWIDDDKGSDLQPSDSPSEGLGDSKAQKEAS